MSAGALTAERLARFATDPAAFIDDVLPNNELGKPWRLADHQRAILRQAFIFDDVGRLPWETIVLQLPEEERENHHQRGRDALVGLHPGRAE